MDLGCWQGLAGEITELGWTRVKPSKRAKCGKRGGGGYLQVSRACPPAWGMR